MLVVREEGRAESEPACCVVGSQNFVQQCKVRPRAALAV